VGVYGGNYMGDLPLYTVNFLFGDISVEMEYRKSKDLSFFVNIMYLFTGNDIKKMYPELNYSRYIPDKNPETYRAIITIGGRYYLRNQNINPYLQIGLTEEYTYVGEYSYYEKYGNGGLKGWSNARFNNSKLEIMAGAGLNIKLYKRLHLDIQYNIYKIVGVENNEYLNHSFNGGLKYNIF